VTWRDLDVDVNRRAMMMMSSSLNGESSEEMTSTLAADDGLERSAGLYSVSFYQLKRWEST